MYGLLLCATPEDSLQIIVIDHRILVSRVGKLCNANYIQHHLRLSTGVHEVAVHNVFKKYYKVDDNNSSEWSLQRDSSRCNLNKFDQYKYYSLG